MLLRDILEANRDFVQKWEGEVTDRESNKLPAKRLAIFSCMDTRLVDMLEPALGLSRGEAKVIKNAGTVVTEDVVRSLAVASYLLSVEEIMVIAHLDCGMATPDADKMRAAMLSRGVQEEYLDSLDLAKWLKGFGTDYYQHVRDVVDELLASPLLPKDIPYHGLLFCPDTGHLELVVNGYERLGAKSHALGK
ncbi:MAG TPA: carbonic anhydrase [Verrucomicrobiae bacterium]|nr:carbonic anhydrase [Verrucomicrobiae bacterium]